MSETDLPPSDEAPRKFCPQEHWQATGFGQYGWYGWTVRCTGWGQWRAYKSWLPDEHTRFGSRDEAKVAVEDFVTWDYAQRNYDREALKRLEAKLRARGSPIFSPAPELDTKTRSITPEVTPHAIPRGEKYWRRYQHISTETAMRKIRKELRENKDLLDMCAGSRGRRAKARKSAH